MQVASSPSLKQGAVGTIQPPLTTTSLLSGTPLTTVSFESPLKVDAITPAGTCTSIQANTDYFDNDLTSVPRSSADQCCDVCSSTSGCKLFVWYNGVCYLKTAQGTTSNKVGATAGFIANTCSSMQPNTDYFGNDISSVARSSADQCCDVCKTTAGCKLFVWYNGICYLKTAQGAASNKVGATAGFLGNTCSSTQPNTDYYGNDLSSIARPTADQCCDVCSNTPDCKLFVWYNGMCYLKNAKGVASYKVGAQAGFLGTIPPPPTCGPTDDATDYPGQDLTNLAANSLGDCCAACQSNVQCNAFAFAQL
ncbi:Aste57867_7312 [Aphanomyces stellatus]|uniref:Aste57867_7312 protein n=1 Tax=Aphanomyces stellatus TaxID=120398 RepID=A0A485KI56_9STRA|nr:hypothetical protein As57867_007286 [Aphanomyces stellatus]VFT84231.1 Aste57867_7312 [Aphanomyces stellatus]